MFLRGVRKDAYPDPEWGSNGMKTSVYLIRHGESVGNRENRVRGRVDFRLNANGTKQARALAGALKEKGIARIYSSPLKRALETAQIIAAQCSCPIIESDPFCNIKLTPWEGRLKTEIAIAQPELWNTWMTDPESLRLEGAETLDQVAERSLGELDRLIEKHRGETFAIVSHRGVLKPMLSAALGIAKPRFWRLHMDTGSFSLLTHDPLHGYCLMGLNSVEHLKDIAILQEFE